MPGVVKSRAENSAIACLALDWVEVKLVDCEEEARRRSECGDISDTSLEGGEPSLTASGELYSALCVTKPLSCVKVVTGLVKN
jgi:hypothetical protein